MSKQVNRVNIEPDMETGLPTGSITLLLLCKTDIIICNIMQAIPVQLKK